jgi:hypothetical protein
MDLSNKIAYRGISAALTNFSHSSYVKSEAKMAAIDVR